MSANAKRSTTRQRRIRVVLSAVVAVCAITAALPGAASAAQAAGTDGAAERVAGVERISVTSEGLQADNHSGDASLTPDGRRVVFTSSTRYLGTNAATTGDTVYVRDRQTGRTTQIGDETPVQAPTIGADGDHVAFPVLRMRNEHMRIHDLRTGWPASPLCPAAYCRMSLGASGQHLAYDVQFRRPEPNQRIEVINYDTAVKYVIDVIHNTEPTLPSLSDDGRFLAYQDGGAQDIFLWDRNDGTPQGPIEGPAKAAELVQISNNGGKVVYRSGADTYVHDTATGTAQLVANVRGVAIDPTGNHLLYAPHDPTTGPSLVLRDLRTGTDETVSDQPATAGIDAVSADGRHVVFQSAAADLVPGDTNGKADVFLRTLR
ncbi:hypothetical protein [Streptomyces yaizuensis]|uniref:PD40 domain-containing protein n=1 Tax=Streptomyces yaizuensis TaxID=2989713 RepID=A0ABQ5NZB4_9ACTN|nr:hypothetical protein [Streptomyces sp. YSPA8]GLF95301.1 PD40 domain-containing protein [Streptomyces sp. YSPA8]